MWLLLALAAAFLSATAETFRKRLVRELDPVGAAFLAAAVASLALLPVVALRTLVAPRPGAGLGLGSGAAGAAGAYWTALLVSGGINAVCAVLVARAYRTSDLSLVRPLTGLTPVFTLVIAAGVLREVPSLVGGVGVVVVTAGTYLLAVGEGGRGFIAPLRALWRDEGARLMLLVAFLYGTSSTYDKVGVLASEPVFWGLSLQVVIAGATGIRILADGEGWTRLRALPRGGWIAGVAAGVATAGMLVAQMTALTVGLAAYVIAVKRTSILLIVLAGGVVFRERRTPARLLAATVILAGLALLAIG